MPTYLWRFSLNANSSVDIGDIRKWNLNHVLYKIQIYANIMVWRKQKYVCGDYFKIKLWPIKGELSLKSIFLSFISTFPFFTVFLPLSLITCFTRQSFHSIRLSSLSWHRLQDARTHCKLITVFRCYHLI